MQGGQSAAAQERIVIVGHGQAVQRAAGEGFGQKLAGQVVHGIQLIIGRGLLRETAQAVVAVGHGRGGVGIEEVRQAAGSIVAARGGDGVAASIGAHPGAGLQPAGRRVGIRRAVAVGIDLVGEPAALAVVKPRRHARGSGIAKIAPVGHRLHPSGIIVTVGHRIGARPGLQPQFAREQIGAGDRRPIRLCHADGLKHGVVRRHRNFRQPAGRSGCGIRRHLIRIVETEQVQVSPIKAGVNGKNTCPFPFFSSEKGSGFSLVRFLGMIFLVICFRDHSVRFPVRLHPGMQLGIRTL